MKTRRQTAAVAGLGADSDRDDAEAVSGVRLRPVHGAGQTRRQMQRNRPLKVPAQRRMVLEAIGKRGATLADLRVALVDSVPGRQQPPVRAARLRKIMASLAVLGADGLVAIAGDRYALTARGLELLCVAAPPSRRAR